MRQRCRWPAIGAALLLVACVVAPAAEDLPEPAVVVVKTGMLAAELQARHLWNLQRLIHHANEVAIPTGAYGTIISVPAIGGWVGSGHTQGAIEEIQQVSLTVDGEAAELTDGATYSGERIVLTKTSLLDKVRLESEYVFSAGRIHERVKLTALEDVAVTTIYPFMHCLSTEATQWMAISQDNKETRGEFSDSGELTWHEGWAWTAAYIPKSGTGFLLRHISAPQGLVVKTGYWDTDRYRKLYVSTPLDENVWRAGRSVEAEVVVTCFEAVPEEWKVVACQVAAGLAGQ